MAVKDLKLTTSLVLKFKTGGDVTKAVTLRKVKTTANHQDVYDVAQLIFGLIDGTAAGIQRQDVSELINE